MSEATPFGIYLHIPYCKAKCRYCDFYSAPGARGVPQSYVDALLRELAKNTRRPDTLYFGGGTPALLVPAQAAALIEAANPLPGAEITLEANPDSACDIKALRTLRRAGFNRLSLGVQSADDGLLRAIGRIHTFAQVQQSVTAARKAGFRNISMDLIYGLPGQTMQQWEDTLSAVIALAPEHISCYGLKLEPGTPLYERRLEETFPDDDAQADMYLYAVTALEQNGYGQYEISNFAKPGYESRHNLKYWRMQEYAGFGPGAHSDFGGVRYAYVRDLDGYIGGRLILSESESDATLTRDYEYIMLSLRTAEGIDRRYFETTYRQRFQPMEELLLQYERAGLACRTENGWRLTPRGFLVSNSIIVALEDALAQQKLRREQAVASGNYRVF
ncbi:MAG TPA: coproporphyrinogen III oxidase [Subdoligranulum sp.]|nr:coproporphyrinogen III oxidase [Subdoligranulum sp.]